MPSKHATTPSEKSRFRNSIHKGEFKNIRRRGNPDKLRWHNGSTDHLFNAYANKSQMTPSSEDKQRGRYRRAVEDIHMARELGNEHLLEVWET